LSDDRSTGRPVTVIVLTANRLARLQECLVSIVNQRHPADQIVVVENGSTDDTPQFLREVRLPVPLTVVSRDGSGSFAAARNEGVRAATGEWVAFLDDDCEADGAWLERLLAAAEAGNLVAVGGAVLPADPLQAPDGFPAEASWAAGLLPEEFFGPDGGRRILPTTSNLLARRDLLLEEPFQETGGEFEEGVAVYRLGREDAEWWRRLRLQGRAMGIAGRAIAWHHVGQDRMEWATLLERAALDGRAHWQRTRQASDLKSAARDVLNAPAALLADMAGERAPLRERWNARQLWLRRQLALLDESVEGEDPVEPTTRFQAVISQIPGAGAAAAKALLRSLLVRTIPILQRSRSVDLAEPPPAHLLVVLHDLLGDAVLAGPLLRQLERGLPQTEVTVLHGPVAGPVLRAMGLRRTRFEAVAPGGAGRNPVAAARLAIQVGRLAPDVVLIAYLHGLSPLPFFALGVPVVGWPHDNGLGHRMWGDLLTHPVAKTQRKHEAAALLDLAAPFGVRTRLERPVLSPGAKANERAEALLADAGWRGEETVVVHLERGGRWKIWPPERFEELVGRLIGAGKKVFLVGGRADRPLARAMARRVGAGCESLHGSIDSGTLAALLGRVALFIGCDSGPAHVAQAVGCRAVLLFGGTESWRWGPLPKLVGEESGPGGWSVVKAAPGDWHGEEVTGCQADAAMRLLSVQTVWTAVAKALGEKENFSARVESH
jgi:ADP-heptose:LPS heptosyltransferase/GT2 family glycosyltransferase